MDSVRPTGSPLLGRMQFGCQHCNVEFPTLGDLLKHLQDLTREMKIPIKFKCGYQTTRSGDGVEETMRLMRVIKNPEEDFHKVYHTDLEVPLIISKTSIMTMNTDGLMLDIVFPSINPDDFTIFQQKLCMIGKRNYYSNATASLQQILKVANDIIPCVGCRNGIEKTYQMTRSYGKRALYPLIAIKSGGMRPAMEAMRNRHLIASMFINHNTRLNNMAKVWSKWKKGGRCPLHMLETRKNGDLFTGDWRHIWLTMSDDCRDSVTTVTWGEVITTMEPYLLKHKHCSDCKRKMKDAIKCITNPDQYKKDRNQYLMDRREDGCDCDSDAESQCESRIHEPRNGCILTGLLKGVKTCIKDGHLHTSHSKEFMSNMMRAAEAQMIGQRKDRHAINLKLAKEEVMMAISITIYRKLNAIGMRIREDLCTLELLALCSLRVISLNFETEFEKKRGVTNWDLFMKECEKEEMLFKKKAEKRSRKRKRNEAKRAERAQRMIEAAKEDEKCDTNNCQKSPIPKNIEKAAKGSKNNVNKGTEQPNTSKKNKQFAAEGKKTENDLKTSVQDGKNANISKKVEGSVGKSQVSQKNGQNGNTAGPAKNSAQNVEKALKTKAEKTKDFVTSSNQKAGNKTASCLETEESTQAPKTIGKKGAKQAKVSENNKNLAAEEKKTENASKTQFAKTADKKGTEQSKVTGNNKNSADQEKNTANVSKTPSKTEENTQPLKITKKKGDKRANFTENNQNLTSEGKVAANDSKIAAKPEESTQVPKTTGKEGAEQSKANKKDNFAAEEKKTADVSKTTAKAEESTQASKTTGKEGAEQSKATKKDKNFAAEEKKTADVSKMTAKAEEGTQASKTTGEKCDELSKNMENNKNLASEETKALNVAKIPVSTGKNVNDEKSKISRRNRRIAAAAAAATAKISQQNAPEPNIKTMDLKKGTDGNGMNGMPNGPSNVAKGESSCTKNVAQNGTKGKENSLNTVASNVGKGKNTGLNDTQKEDITNDGTEQGQQGMRGQNNGPTNAANTDKNSDSYKKGKRGRKGKKNVEVEGGTLVETLEEFVSDYGYNTAFNTPQNGSVSGNSSVCSDSSLEDTNPPKMSLERALLKNESIVDGADKLGPDYLSITQQEVSYFQTHAHAIAQEREKLRETLRFRFLQLHLQGCSQNVLCHTF